VRGKLFFVAAPWDWQKGTSKCASEYFDAFAVVVVIFCSS